MNVSFGCIENRLKHKRGLFHISVTLAVVIWLFLPIPQAASQEVTDDEVKAALTFKFPVYVRWPESALNDGVEFFYCCILGNSRLSELLMQFDGETVLDKEIRVERISSAQEIEKCHMLFIGDSPKSDLQEIWKAIEGKPILTVGDMNGFAREGGIINFIRKEDSVHFEINPKAGRKAGLEISSKLLRLAEITQ